MLFPVTFWAPSFQPSDLAGLALWLRADTISGVDGDLISTWSDQSSGAKHATASGATRPTLKIGILNGLAVARFAGAQAMTIPAIDLSASTGVTLLIVAKMTTTGVDRTLYEYSTNYNSFTDSFGLIYGNADTRYTFGGRGGAYATYRANQSVGDFRVWTGVMNRALATNESSLAANGLLDGTVTNNGNTTGAFGNRASYIGGRAASSLFFIGDIAEIILYSRALSVAERAQVEAYLGAKWGIYYPMDAAQFADNGYSDVGANYTRSSPLARARFTTDAPTVEVDTYTDIYGTFPSFAKLGVRVNGADQATLATTATGANRLSAALGAGLKTVEVIAGLQSAPSGTVLGTFIRSVSFLGGATAARLSSGVANRLVVYGDSIATGANATNPALQAWPQLLRANWPGSVLVEAWGYRTLYDDANTSGLRAAFVARLVSYGPSALWLAIGTNDYGLNKWGATSFGAAYAALLDDLHTALPSLTIYCQTPVLRVSPANETANGSGSTLNNYRTQIATAQAARNSYCVLVDGTTILASGDFDTDGIHPTTAGHAVYRTAARGVLGV